jgi:peptidylprolyl isomerase domain and WD repeat-containing protein 1
MIQTGDPLGNGTGGESIWGGEFEDEFVRELVNIPLLCYVY